MKITRLWFALLILTFFAHSTAEALTAPACGDPPSFVEAKHYEGVDFNHLPDRVFVARTLEVWASQKERGYKLMARHNFKTMKSDVRCTKPPYEGTVNLTGWVPALLDLSPEKKWGDSVWQFQAVMDTRRTGVWSQKSKLAPVDEIRRIAQKGVWRALDPDSYELIWEQNVNGSSMWFRVVFDVMGS